MTSLDEVFRVICLKRFTNYPLAMGLFPELDCQLAIKISNMLKPHPFRFHYSSSFNLEKQ